MLTMERTVAKRQDLAQPPAASIPVHLEVDDAAFNYRLGHGARLKVQKAGTGVLLELADRSESVAILLGQTVVGLLCEFLDGKGRNVLVNRNVKGAPGPTPKPKHLSLRELCSAQRAVGVMPSESTMSRPAKNKTRKGRARHLDYDRIVADVRRYFQENPKGTWRGAFETVPNHYATEASLQGVMPPGIRKNLKQRKDTQ